MSIRRVVFVVCLLAGGLPLFAQSSGGDAKDFWTGFGRYGAVKNEPPDLSGKYEVKGAPSDPTKTYDTTLDMSRAKTLTTPEDAKVNFYRLTWNWSDGKVTGIGVWIGTRLYVAYGSERLGLYIVAPLVVSAGERPRYDQYWDVEAKAGAERNRNDRAVITIKNQPFFAHVTPSRQTSIEPAYYALWFTAKLGYGHTIVRSLPVWKEGSFTIWDHFLKDNGEDNGITGTASHWYISRIGENYKVIETLAGPRNLANGTLAGTSDKDTEGTAFTLEDGTVLMVMGGNNKCGFGYYEVKDKTLFGPWAEQFATDRGTERLIPSAAILTKNARLFGQ